jgi:hypothetical protein
VPADPIVKEIHIEASPVERKVVGTTLAYRFMKSSRQMNVVLKALAEPRRVAILTAIQSRRGQDPQMLRDPRAGPSSWGRYSVSECVFCSPYSHIRGTW